MREGLRKLNPHAQGINGQKRVQASRARPPARSRAHSKLPDMADRQRSLLCTWLRAGAQGLPVLISSRLYPHMHGPTHEDLPNLISHLLGTKGRDTG
jgi:hypothetical protein